MKKISKPKDNVNDKILIVPDLHCPFEHRDAIAFLKAVKKKYRPTRIIFTGDEMDGHSFSFHQNESDSLFTPAKELEQAIYHLQPFYKLFPKADIMESNHGSLVYRKSNFAGLPRSVIKSYREILDAPAGWTWHYSLELDVQGNPVVFHHGVKASAINQAKMTLKSQVYGHYHTILRAVTTFISGKKLFGVNAGCLIDVNAYAFNYGKAFAPNVKLGCALIIDGNPIVVQMKLNNKNRWVKRL